VPYNVPVDLVAQALLHLRVVVRIVGPRVGILSMNKVGTDPGKASPSSQRVADLMRGGLPCAPATAALICINATVFAVMLAHGAGLWHSPNNIQLAWGAGFGPATKDGEWWRLGSAMFLHFGLVHLAMNMVALWEAGQLVERLYGSRRFLVGYFVSGIAGNLTSLIAQGDQAVSGGASGAVFGIYGALLVCLWRERGQIHPTDFRWLFGGAAVFSVATMLLGLLIPGIDNAAHIGGLITGALTGMTLASPLSANSPNPRHARWVATGALTVLAIALVCSIPAASYRWQEELQAREEIRQFQQDDQRIIDRWQHILEKGRQGSATFEQLAGQIETDVTKEYRDSFEQLSALHLDPAAPSRSALEILKTYAQLRGDAAQSLTEALRQNDRERIREALEMARQAPYIARGIDPPRAPVPSR
jgi:rhomboid protease GluP